MKIKLLIFSLVLFVTANAQSQSFLWAKAAGGTNNDEGNSIATDANGNVYVTGRFQSPSITFGTTTLTKVGTLDFFIVKYDASGNVLWAKGAAGTKDDVGQSIATDANGNVFVTGYFYSPSITFGTITLMNSSIADDIFVVKYDASGNVLWAKSEGGTGYEDGQSIATDANGNVFVTGHFSSTSISFGTTTLTNTSSPAGEIFVVKYDSSGNVLWAKIGGESPLTERVNSVTTDANGNAYVIGSFYHSSIWFGTINLTKTTTTESDLFVVKYDASGNVLWAKVEGGAGNDDGRSITTDANGNVFITGYFKSPSITFGTTTLMNVGTSIGSLNIFVVKYDSIGNALWAKGAGENDAEIANGITTDANGNAYVTGTFNSSSISFGTNTLTKTGSTYYSDIFVVKYDSIGNALWAKGVGGTDSETGFGITTDANGNVFLTGYFYSPSITFGTTTLTNTGGSLFVTKLGGSVTGIDDLSYNSKIKIFPNPFSSSTTLQANENLKDATLIVYDSFGQAVKEIKNISGKTITFSRNNLASGVYFIQLKEGNKIYVHKLVIFDK